MPNALCIFGSFPDWGTTFPIMHLSHLNSSRKFYLVLCWPHPIPGLSISFWCWWHDTQLSLSVPQLSPHHSVSDISAWMGHCNAKLNMAKTKHLVFPPKPSCPFNKFQTLFQEDWRSILHRESAILGCISILWIKKGVRVLNLGILLSVHYITHWHFVWKRRKLNCVSSFCLSLFLLSKWMLYCKEGLICTYTMKETGFIDIPPPALIALAAMLVFSSLSLNW